MTIPPEGDHDLASELNAYLASGKISVAFLILRIMGKSEWGKAFFISGAMIGSFLFCTIAIVLTFVQCQPVTALWNPQLVVVGKAKCWSPQRQSDFSLFPGSMSKRRSM